MSGTTPSYIQGIHLEERHPVDEALGCMIPAAILGLAALLALLNTLRLLL